MKNLFSITYEIITPDSAENGDDEERGFIDENMTLKEAYQQLLEARRCHCEANTFSVRDVRWLTFYNVREDLDSGSSENWSLHFPKHLTEASRKRLARLFGVRGA